MQPGGMLQFVAERGPRKVRARCWILVGTFLGATLLAGCSSGSSAAAGPISKITASWSTFFNGETSPTNKAAVLQNGGQFESVIANDLGTTPQIAKTVGVSDVRVDKVTGTSARVTYTYNTGGGVSLKNQVGSAVIQDGQWKVSESTFCDLLNLDGVKVAGCKSIPTSTSHGLLS